MYITHVYKQIIERWKEHRKSLVECRWGRAVVVVGQAGCEAVVIHNSRVERRGREVVFGGVKSVKKVRG